MAFTRIDYPDSVAVRFAYCLGKKLNLIDNQPTPQPRPATAAECKAWLIAPAKAVIEEIEARELQAAAPPIVVPPVDMT